MYIFFNLINLMIFSLAKINEIQRTIGTLFYLTKENNNAI